MLLTKSLEQDTKLTVVVPGVSLVGWEMAGALGRQEPPSGSLGSGEGALGSSPPSRGSLLPFHFHCVPGPPRGMQRPPSVGSGRG